MKSLILRDFPLANKKLLILFVFISALVGAAFDYWSSTHIDDWVHDSALVFQVRKQWKYTGIVVLDDQVPIRVGRKQALPLFVRATEQLINAGAKGVFLDARVAKEMEGRMPYAVCIEANGQVQWSMPECFVTDNQQCQISNSSVGGAPLQMSEQAINRFVIAPYLSGQENLPDFLLYGWDAMAAIPERGLVGSDRLVTRDSPIARYLDLSRDHAVIKLARFSSFEQTEKALQANPDDEICNDRRRCRRIRLSRPVYGTQLDNGRLILPVSQLASCDQEIANRMATLLKDKVVILQLTSPTEATDIIVTPMTTALLGPNAITPGAQYLADAVETLLNADHPRKPDHFSKALLLFIVAAAGVLAAAFLRQIYVWLGAVLLLLGLAGLCFLNPLTQLWPVTASMLAYFTGVGQVVGMFLIIGYREGVLISHYMPSQIHNLLISLKSDEPFQNRRCNALVLMSDLAGYTRVTGILKEPGAILELMNDYLSETSFVLQDKYNGWLESYVGDMVCYYWPYKDQEQEESYKNALRGAMELYILQKRFFLSLNQRYWHKIDPLVLEQVRSTINAGIGLAAGIVVMGDLGPNQGVRKFGILGDPLILAARLESLTRFYNTEIIVSGDFVQSAQELGFVARYLGRVVVKGRNKAEDLFALGYADDPRFAKSAILEWERWIRLVEKKLTANQSCPEIYNLDRETIKKWLAKGLLGDDGVWYLDEK